MGEDNRIKEYFDSIDALSEKEFEKWAVDVFKLRKVWVRIPKINSAYQRVRRLIVKKALKSLKENSASAEAWDAYHANNGFYRFVSDGKKIQYDVQYDLLEVFYENHPGVGVGDSDRGDGVYLHHNEETGELVGFTVFDFMDRGFVELPIGYSKLKTKVQEVMGL